MFHASISADSACGFALSVICVQTRGGEQFDIESITKIARALPLVQLVFIRDCPNHNKKPLSFVSNISNISIITHEVPAGTEAAFNTGLILADAPFVFFAQPDTLLDLNVLNALLAQVTLGNADAIIPQDVLIKCGADCSKIDSTGTLSISQTTANEALFAALFTLPAAGIVWRRALFSNVEFPYVSNRWFRDMYVVARLVCSARQIRVCDPLDQHEVQTCWDFSLDAREDHLVELFKAFGLTADNFKRDQRRPFHFDALARCAENLLIALCEKVHASDLEEGEKRNYLQNALLLKMANFTYRDSLKTLDKAALVELLGSARRFKPLAGLIWP
jgi:hypothetical protein